VLCNRLDAICPKNSEKYKARIFVALGHIYYIDGTMVSMSVLNYKKATDMKEIQKYIPAYDYAVLLAMCGHNSMLIGEMDAAKKQLDECYSLSKTLPNNRALLSMSLTLLSTLQERIGNFEKAEEISSEAIKILKNQKEKWAFFILVQAYYFSVCHHARRYLREQKNDLCMAYAQKIFDIYDNKQLSCQRTDNNSSERYPTYSCFAKNMLAMYYNMLGKYKTSLEEYSLPNEKIMAEYKEEDVPLTHRVFLESEKNYSLLWPGKPKLAEDKLSEVIEKLKYLNNSKLLIYAIFYRIEAGIILGKLNEAYEDCKFAIDFKRWNQDNTSLVRRNTCHYHAAVIKYKQKDYALSLKHFSDFLQSMNEFCKGFLEKDVYEKLLNTGAFEIIKEESQIKICFQNSLKIFSAIYGENHPFVKNYVSKPDYSILRLNAL
jgi:tetratricopeptide (TPR) repeat protein